MQQAKASIIVTCYNKEKYITGMFDSILTQKWNNVEVVLVNDGSTDGTGEIITEYAAKFEKRGFSTIIINQENSGVITAAKNGLLACTGDYFCIVDADDKLNPEYISLPVSILEKHKEFDYTMCNFKFFNGNKYTNAPKLSVSDHEKNLIEIYLLGQIYQVAWRYMVRSSYFNKKIIKNIYRTFSKASHEPEFVIPLTAYKGSVKVIDKALYCFCDIPDKARHSYYDLSMHLKSFQYLKNYAQISKIAINSLPNKIVNKVQKERFIMLAKFRCIHLMLLFCYNSNYLTARFELKKHFNNLLKLTNRILQIDPPIKASEIQSISFINSLPKVFLLNKPDFKPAKRIICYGTLGKISKQWLPFIQSRAKIPIVLWDKNGDGKGVKKPNFKTLRKSDVMFVLPKREEVINEVKMELKKVKFENALFNPEEWSAFLFN